MNYVLRLNSVPTANQMEQALKELKPMALAKMSLMEYSSWSLKDYIHGIYVFYHYDQVIYLGSCRSRTFAARISAHWADSRSSSWMNSLPRYAQEKYNLESIKEGIEYIFQEFSVALIVVPSFRNKSECTEEEWEKEAEKIKGLLTLENDLRFRLQPEFNPRGAQVSKPSSRTSHMPDTKTKAPKQTKRQFPSRPITEKSDSNKQFLVLNLAKHANAPYNDIKTAAEGPWRIPSPDNVVHVVAWLGNQVFAIWTLFSSKEEEGKYYLNLGRDVTTEMKATIEMEIGPKFRLYSVVKRITYQSELSVSPTASSEEIDTKPSNDDCIITLEDGVLKNTPSNQEGRLFSSLTTAEKQGVHTVILRRSKLVNLTLLSDMPHIQTLTLNLCFELKDIEALVRHKELQTLRVIACPRIQKFSVLSSLSKLIVLEIIESETLSDVSFLSKMLALQSLHFAQLKNLSNITALNGLLFLSSIQIEGCSLLKKIQLSTLPQLEHISFDNTIEELHYQSIPRLKIVSLARFQNLKRVTLEGVPELRELKFLACPLLEELNTDVSCTQLQNIHIGECPKLNTYPLLAQQTAIESLILHAQDNVHKVPTLHNGKALQSLSLTMCSALTDVSTLSAYPNIETLDLSMSGVHDLTPIGHLPHLQHLSIQDCENITDISVLQQTPKLKGTLNLRGCTQLKNFSLSHSLLDGFVLDDAIETISLQHCPNLERLLLNRLPSLFSVSLINLPSLQDIDLRKCIRLIELTNLTGLPRLNKILLRECSSFRDISGISNLPALSELDIKGCPELQEETLYPTLYTLKQLHTLKSELPSHALAKLMAKMAFERQDIDLIRNQIENWIFAARQYPSVPNILNNLAHAISLLPNVEEFLNPLVQLTAKHDVQGVQTLFDVVKQHLENPKISQTCTSILEQKTLLLPPQTLCAYHSLFPHQSELKEYSVRAMIRSLEQKNPEDWILETQQNILNLLHSAISIDTIEKAFLVLQGEHWTQEQVNLFGIICNAVIHIPSPDWQSKTFARLQNQAFQQQEYSILESCLSFLIRGVSMSENMLWMQSRLDDILTQAANINPDTSVLRATCAQAQAEKGRWDQAIQIAFEIANQEVHDQTLCTLIKKILATTPNHLSIAISLTAGIRDYLMRREQLLQLQKEKALLDDMVAFGQMVQLLLEYPEQLSDFVATTVAQRPTIGALEISAIQAFTDREQTLLAQRDQAWLSALSDVSPQHIETLRQKMEASLQKT